MILLPKKENDWTAIHHLKHFCSNNNDFVVDGVNGVIFTTKDSEGLTTKVADDHFVSKNMKGKTFPFEELTNFQASKLENGPITTDGSWNASGPFYTIGTLAYFMKCLGLKFSAYVRYVSYCKIRS